MKLSANIMTFAATIAAGICVPGARSDEQTIFQDDQSRNFEPRCVMAFNWAYTPPTYNIEQISGLCFTLMKEQTDTPTSVELFLGSESRLVKDAARSDGDFSRGRPARSGFSLGTLGAAYGGLLPAPAESNWSFVRYRLEPDIPATARTPAGEESRLDVYLSRVSTAILIRSNTDRITLFKGISPPDLFAVPQDESVALVAHRAGAGISSGILNAQASDASAPGDDLGLELVGMGDPWVLAWWGMETLYSADFSGTRVKADKPVLLVFSEAPSGVVHESGWGGMTFEFAQPGASVLLQPLSGDAKADFTGAEVDAEKLTYVSNDYAYPANVTEGWLKTGLPDAVRNYCDLWCEYLARFPVSVCENYAWDAAAGKVEITEKFEFIDVRENGTPFVLLPPMLALSRQEGLSGLSFSAEVKDTGLNCGLGPVCGVEGEGYTWGVDNIGKYVWEELSIDAGSTPEYLRAILEKEVAKILDAGHLFPFSLSAGVNHFGWLGRERPPFLNPGATPRYLAPLMPLLPVEQAGRLLEYLRAERETYPPEQVFSTIYYDGAPRNFYADFREIGPPQEPLAPPQRPKQGDTIDPYIRLNMMPIENYYALAQYYARAGGAERDWPDLQCAIEPWLAFQDWALMGMPDLRARKWNNFVPLAYIGKLYSYYFNGGVMDANRFAEGAIGYARLARLAGDKDAEAFGVYLAARALIQRHAMAFFMDNLCRRGLEGPLDYSNWVEARQHKLHSGWWPRTYERRGTSGEIRQVVAFYHGGPTLNPLTGMDFYGGPMCAPAFIDLAPEVARFLHDTAFEPCVRFIRAWDESNPLWFAAYKASECGGETLMELPHNSHSLFVASALVRGDTAEELERKMDVPYCIGDLCFLDKLRLVMAACSGGKWTVFDADRRLQH